MLIFCATQPNEYFKSHGCVPVHHFHTEAMKLSLSDSEVKNWGGGRKSERGDAKTVHQVKNSGAGILKKVVCYCGWTSGFDPLSTNAIIICSSSCNTVHDGSLQLPTVRKAIIQKAANKEDTICVKHLFLDFLWLTFFDYFVIPVNHKLKKNLL